MANLVNDFMESSNELTTVKLTDAFSEALEKMLENDFSQLPVVDNQNKPIGFVTYQSITRTLMYRDTPQSELFVFDVSEEINDTQIVRNDDAVSDMLDRLRNMNAIVVVDEQERLTGIVTTYDSTEYLRARSEDLLNVQDVESSIKYLLRSMFRQEEGEPDNEILRTAIQKVTKPNLISRKDYSKVLQQYLDISGGGEINQMAMTASYEELFKETTEVKSFSELTFGDYIALLLHKDQQSLFEELFNHPSDHMRKLLDEVRNIRNRLAHLRDITPIQRDQLLHCKRLLDRVSIPADWQLTPQDISSVNIEEAIVIVPIDEETQPGESRYSPLADLLNSQPGGIDVVSLTFEEIEKLIGGSLPVSAYEHRAWWANDSKGHPHSQLWLEAGWRTNYLNRTEKVVTFVRIRELEKAYIEFFSKLLAELREKAKFPVKQISSDGSNWVVCQTINTKGLIVGQFNYSFARGKKFRVELYIDTSVKETTKQVFDSLHAQREIIESTLGELSWERIDGKRASRIAYYCPGQVTDEEEQLKVLREWAVEKMIALYTVLEPIASKVFKEVLKP